jgi:syntaxin 1B/2/3
MAPLTQNGSSYGSERSDPNAILNECREIDKGIYSIERTLENLKSLQQRSLDDPDSSANSATNKQLDSMSSETMTMYRNFAGRIKTIKQQPESGSPKNAPQLGKVDRRLKAAIKEYQIVDADFRKKLQEQMARQYRIVRPEASEAEVREAVEDTSNQQVFSQALLQSDRRGQSRSALNAVQDRHAAIQKIESQMIELAELFQDMEQLVVQQEAAVVNIEMKGEVVVENMDKGTQEIGTAIKSARNARKWKWWCLGIVGMFTLSPLLAIRILIFNSSYYHHHCHYRSDLQIRHPKQRHQQAAFSRVPRHANRGPQSRYPRPSIYSNTREARSTRCSRS